MSTRNNALTTDVAEAAEESANVNVKQEPTSGSEEEEREELDAGSEEYPVESVYVKGEPPEEISSTHQESDDEVQAIHRDVNPIEENKSDQAGEESADKPSTGRRFIFDPVLGSYRQTNCPSPPPVLVEEDPLSLKQLKKAADKQKRDSVRPFKCLQCEKTFAVKYCLKSHMLTHTDERPFGCPVCGKKFKLNGDVTLHMVIHGGERPFKCDECDKRFARRGDLRMHAFTHTGETRFGCEQCEKKFVRSRDLKTHIMYSHTSERHFGCQQCEKKFVRPTDLKTHMYSHTGERRFSCQQCDKKFFGSFNLKIHMYSHTGERPFSCSLCTRKFTLRNELKLHELTHSDHFKCRVCKKTFASDRNLKGHFKTAHGEEKAVAEEPSALVAKLADQGPSAVAT